MYTCTFMCVNVSTRVSQNTLGAQKTTADIGACLPPCFETESLYCFSFEDTRLAHKLLPPISTQECWDCRCSHCFVWLFRRF